MHKQILIALSLAALIGCSPNRTPEQEAADINEASARIQEAMIKAAALPAGKRPQATSETSAPAAISAPAP